VFVEIASSPPGAQLLVDDEEAGRGVTPMRLALPRSDRETRIRLLLDGYEPKTIAVAPNRDQEMELTLEPIKKAGAARPRPNHKRSQYLKLSD
jgi:hypothetical protein